MRSGISKQIEMMGRPWQSDCSVCSNSTGGILLSCLGTYA